MEIAIITPAARGSQHGNRHTAARWAGLLGDLGHRVTVTLAWDGSPVDVMIALHARRSHESIRWYSAACPGKPLLLVLTGTDLYRDIRHDAAARESMRLATRLVVLQERGIAELTAAQRRKTRIIYQSAVAVARKSPLQGCFEVVVSGHLREEKDPFRAVRALAHLPSGSRIRITHIGAAMSLEMERAARSWAELDPRYHWLGGVPHGMALRLLARSRLLVMSSRMEGGANVVSEALAAGVPVVASRVPGNVGMLGGSYAGYYPVGNERALARLLRRCERDPVLLRLLVRQCRERRALVKPQREQESLRQVLAELA